MTPTTTTTRTPSKLSLIGLSALPTTPVGFTGDTAMIAWLRLAVYGTASIATFGKYRRLSYVLIGATGLSLITSLSADAMAQKTLPVTSQE